MLSAFRPLPLRRVLLTGLLCGVIPAFTGCTTIKIPYNGIPNPTPSTGLTGNWQFQLTPTGGPVPFTSLAGFINETAGTSSTSGDPVTAALQAQPSTCFLGATLIPLQGTVKTSQLSLYSFSIVGQFVTVNATADSTSSHLTGTYSVGGGCADGAAGTLTGTRYSAVTGAYNGSITGSSPAKTISLNVTQMTQGQGDGSFLVTGTAAFSGFGCFTSGTVTGTTSAVIGDTLNLTLSTNDSGGGQVILSGTLDAAADTLMLNQVQILGGNCAGSAGGATLTRST